MVSVTIFVEGGVLPNINVQATTVNNSQRLRESFRKLFRKVLAEEHFDLNAPTMLELLDIHELRKTFEDVENLIQHIESKKN